MNDLKKFVYPVPKPMPNRYSGDDDQYLGLSIFGYFATFVFFYMAEYAFLCPITGADGSGGDMYIFPLGIAVFGLVCSTGYCYTALMDRKSRVPHKEWQAGYDAAKKVWLQQREAFAQEKTEQFQRSTFPLICNDETRALAGQGSAEIVVRRLVIFSKDGEYRGLTLNPERVVTGVSPDQIPRIRFADAKFYWSGKNELAFEFGAKEGVVEILT